MYAVPMWPATIVGLHLYEGTVEGLPENDQLILVVHTGLVIGSWHLGTGMTTFVYVTWVVDSAETLHSMAARQRSVGRQRFCHKSCGRVSFTGSSSHRRCLLIAMAFWVIAIPIDGHGTENCRMLWLRQ